MKDIIEFSMTPMPKLVYLWKLVSGFIWVILLILFNNTNQDFSPIIATLVVMAVSNFMMILVLLATTSLLKNIKYFIEKLMEIGNMSLLSLSVGSLVFIAINSIAPLKVSLMVASMITSIVFSSVVVYMSTKLLNGNYIKVGAVNMWSVILQAAIMYGTIFLLGF